MSHERAIEELKLSIDMRTEHITDLRAKVLDLDAQIVASIGLITAFSDAIEALNLKDGELEGKGDYGCLTCALNGTDCAKEGGVCSSVNNWPGWRAQPKLEEPKAEEPVSPRNCNTCKKSGLTFVECTNGTNMCNIADGYSQWEAKDA